jgi:integrase
VPKARDGAKLKLTPFFVTRKKLSPGLYWDTKQDGLAIRVQPTGYKAYVAIYTVHGRPRWYTIGSANGIDLTTARKQARSVMNAVVEGKDPQADKKAKRLAGTFEELANSYVEDYAKKNNKSWQQAAALVKRYVLPRWAKLKPADITRDDVKTLRRSIKATMLANQVVASVSAIFTWAMGEEGKGVEANPCSRIGWDKPGKRERVLSEPELPRFWDAFDEAGLAGTALKLILLTGQRPGEVSHMRHEHVEGGWWELPGKPIPALGWPGTKNGQNHRVWLPEPAQKLITTDGDGFVLARGGQLRLDDTMRAICTKLGIADKVTPHDLRRTHGTTITGMGFGREAMNRIQNHKEGGVTDVYDRHEYAEENRRVMEAVAARIVALAEGKPVASNVVALASR